MKLYTPYLAYKIESLVYNSQTIKTNKKRLKSNSSAIWVLVRVIPYHATKPKLSSLKSQNIFDLIQVGINKKSKLKYNSHFKPATALNFKQFYISRRLQLIALLKWWKSGIQYELKLGV